MKKPEATGIEGQRDGVMDYSSLNRLRLIKAPTLVIAGTKDRVINIPLPKQLPRIYQMRAWLKLKTVLILFSQR